MMVLGIRSREQKKLKGHKRAFLVFFPEWVLTWIWLLEVPRMMFKVVYEEDLGYPGYPWMYYILYMILRFK